MPLILSVLMKSKRWELLIFCFAVLFFVFLRLPNAFSLIIEQLLISLLMIMINCKGFTGFFFISENAKLKNSVNMLKMLRLGRGG